MLIHQPIRAKLCVKILVKMLIALVAQAVGYYITQDKYGRSMIVLYASKWP